MSNSRWLVKKKIGQVSGPHTTAEIIQLIQEGEVSEEEHIALYPGTQWFPISKNPEFYDVMLDVLAGVVPEARDEEKAADEIELEKSAPKKPLNERIQEQKKQAPKKQAAAPDVEEDIVMEPQNFTSKDNTKNRKSKSDEVIELKPREKAVKRQKIKTARWPAILIIVAGLAFFKMAFFTEESQEHRIHLLGPKNKTTMSNQQLSENFNAGTKYFNLDTFRGYLAAQNKFVSVVEANPRGSSQLAMLCLVYNELWPYTFQDPRDIAVLSRVVQDAKRIDPAGPDGNTCRVVELLIKGKFEEADAATEGVLTAFGNAAQPPVVFYFFKALNLEKTNNLQAARGYLSSLQRLWPNWMKPYVLEARLLEKSNDFSGAETRLKQVVGANPNHKEAMLKLGLLEYKKFFRYDQAAKFLGAGIKISDEVSPKLMSDAYLALAEMALKDGNESKALKYAELSYENFSANQAAKNLLIQLGGAGRLKNAKVREDALVEEGRLLEKEGDCNSAQAHFKAAYERNPKNATAALLAAKCLWRLSFSTEAIDWLNKSIVADSNLVESYLTLADYYSQRYNFEAASIILQKANRISKNNYEVFRAYATTEFRRRNYSGAIDMAKQTLTLNDSDVETNILISQAYMKEKNFSEAYNYANKSIELDPNNRSAHVVFGRALTGVQGVEAGIDYLNKLIQQFPLVTEYRMALGRVLMEDERYQAAKEIFNQVIEIDKDKKPKEALVELGTVEKALGNYKAAVEIFFDAAVLDAADPSPLFEAGILFLTINRPADAKVQFERVNRVNPLFPLVHYYIGKAALLSGDTQTALDMVNEERKINPKLPEPFLLAAEAYSQSGQFSLCAKEYQSAIQLQPQGALIYVKLASCYRRAGELDIAGKMLNQAATIESGLADIYREQGQVYETKGDRVRALEAYDQYLVLNPSAPDAKQVKQQMMNLRR